MSPRWISDTQVESPVNLKPAVFFCSLLYTLYTMRRLQYPVHRSIMMSCDKDPRTVQQIKYKRFLSYCKADDLTRLNLLIVCCCNIREKSISFLILLCVGVIA